MDRIPQVTVLAGSLRKESYNRRMALALKAIAQALMREIIRSATSRGADLVWLGVWENNPRAIAF